MTLFFRYAVPSYFFKCSNCMKNSFLVSCRRRRAWSKHVVAEGAFDLEAVVTLRERHLLLQESHAPGVSFASNTTLATHEAAYSGLANANKIRILCLCNLFLLTVRLDP